MAHSNRATADSTIRYPAQSPLQRPAIERLIRWSWSALHGVAARTRQRRALGDLDDRLLHDIGVTRSMAQRESAKPFWRS